MTILQVSSDAPSYIRAAANTILYVHIGGGTLGMISGAAALVFRKGERLHRLAGNVFFVSMLAMATVGATVSPFLGPFLSEAPNMIAGILAFYLVLTSWVTVRREEGRIGRIEIGGFIAALTVTLAGAYFIYLASSSASGTIGKVPPEAFYVFTLVGSIATISDLKVILSGGISGVPRIARHLWRMCTALAMATGSFFLGQQKFLPAALHGSPLLFIPTFAPLVLMAFWLIRIRIGRAYANSGISHDVPA